MHRLKMFDDMHLHIRRGEMLRNVLPHTVDTCARAIIMPNTEPPILTGQDVLDYRHEIISTVFSTPFNPLMTIQLTTNTTVETVASAYREGAVAGKIYPRGMTTNSENGILDYHALRDVYKAMEELHMVLLLHGESPQSDFCLDREKDFLPVLLWLRVNFPNLRVVLEHITTESAAEYISELPENFAATITVHHLFLTLNDVVGGKLKPHYFCKPLAKRPQDLKAIQKVALSGNPKFFLGTDSAPHPQEAKECADGCAGVFTAPVAVPLLAEFFSASGSAGWVKMLEDFGAKFGADFYRLSPNEQYMVLRKDPWTVPATYGNVVPFRAGQVLEWQVSAEFKTK